jgi:hypothetical protein
MLRKIPTMVKGAIFINTKIADNKNNTIKAIALLMINPI